MTALEVKESSEGKRKDDHYEKIKSGLPLKRVVFKELDTQE